MISLFSCAWGFLLGMIGFGLGGCALGPHFVKKELF